jgi:glycine/D-amino acid oxidase-like deaminating enzyme
MNNYYESTVARGEPWAPLRGDHECEVCIIGAGFAGLATALGLVERGRRDVVVLEAERVAYGASGRNGGFVFGGYSLDCGDLLAQLGPVAARACYGLTRAAVDLIRRRIKRYAIECDAVEGGALMCNWFEDETVLLRQQALMQQHYDVRWQLISRAELEAHVVSARYFGALLEPDAFHFHPLKYALGAARAVVAGGARVHEHSAVQAVEPAAGGGFRVITNAGSVRARHVLVAGGGYLHSLLPALERAILPIATFVMVTEPLGALQRELIPSPAAIYDTRFAFDYYRVLQDTRLLWGGRISVFDRSPAAIAGFLRRDLARVYPRLRDVAIDFAWSGKMSYARHKMPQIGRLQHGRHKGLWYGLAFGGHGVAPTTVAGEWLAEALVEGAAPSAGLAFARYGLPRTYRPAGLIAAQATYGWMQLRDRWRER